MKRHFITGLIILLPLALTIMVVSLLFNMLTEPFLGITQIIFDHFGIFNHGMGIFNAAQVREYAAKFFIVLFLFSFTLILGAVARWFLFRYFLHLWDFILHRIPIVRSIYKTSQDVISTLFGSSGNSFKKVVLAPFPNKDTLSIGFISREDLPNPNSSDPNSSLVAVFMPTTPNPTSGFLVMFAKNDLIYLDMKVEDAFKYIVSCGVIPTPIKVIPNEDSSHPS